MSWFYSVSEPKYEDPKLPNVSITMRQQTYLLPQPVDQVANKEIRQFYYQQVAAEREKRKAEFLHDFYSTIWVTYRKNFTGLQKVPGIPKEHQLTSDSGWGCMIRSGQMLLSNCILRHLFRGTKFSLTLVDQDPEARILYISLLWQ